MELDIERSTTHSAKEDSISSQLDDASVQADVSLDDAEKPVNWPISKKVLNFCIIWMFTTVAVMGSSMCAPSIPLVMQEFHNSSELYGVWVLSVYVLGFAFGPLIAAPLSELYGRLVVYHIFNTFFLIFIVACAVSDSLGMLAGFRFLAGLAGSGPITLGAGSVGDFVVPHRRGIAIAVWSIGALMGPAVSPVIGGFLSQAKGWRWIYWLLAIVWGFTLVVSFVLMSETYPPELLRRKAKRMRSTKSEKTGPSSSSVDIRALVWTGISRPIKMLISCPDIFCLSMYTTFVYGVYYIFLTSMSQTFEDTYGFGRGVIGLAYIGLGIGAVVGMLICGHASDVLVRRMSKDGEIKPEHRLPPIIPGSVFTPIGLLWFGWSVMGKVHWIVPIIGTVWIGVGNAACFMPSTYMIDAYPRYAASAIAANTVIRSVGGAVLPLAGPSLYANLGQGWGNSLLAFISMLVVPMTVFLYKYSARLRAKSPYANRA